MSSVPPAVHSAPRSVHAALSYAQRRPEAQLLYRTAFQHFATPILSSVGGPLAKTCLNWAPEMGPEKLGI